MSKRFLGILLAIVVVFIGIVYFSNHKSSNSGSSAQLTNHVEGQDSKGVTLVEYGDYECPICGAYYPVLKQVYAKYSSEIQFQFRNFPLTSIHPNAFAGARAAEAAGLQNKYWQMHDLLYENQTTWANSSDPTSYFNAYAQQLGLNLTQFKSDYASDKINNLVNADLSQANKLGLTGTPSFFLDGKAVDLHQLIDSSGQPNLANFSKVIDAAIASKSKTS